MNILMIAHEADLGGASLSLLGLIDELAEEHNIVVLCSAKTGLFREELKSRKVSVICQKFYCWALPKRNGKIRNCFRKTLQGIAVITNTFIAKKIVRVIKDKEFQVIHSNSSIINIGGLLHKITKIPHIWHVREFVEEGCDMDFVLGKRYSYRFMDQYSSRILVVSDALKTMLINYIEPNKIVRVYNGIPAEEQEEQTLPDEIKVEKEAMNVLIAGRVDTYKGQKDAILAVHQLIKRGYDKIHLWIAGDGELETCQKLIAECNLNQKITLLGRISYLTALRKHMDVELVCSKSEAFGRVTIEAYLSGIPVIGADTGGTKELVRDGETGFLYRQGDIGDLSKKIEIMYKNRPLITQMGQSAYAWANNRFTAKVNAQAVYEQYCDLIR